MPAIKVEHINPFIASAIETFSTMCDITVQPGKPVSTPGTNSVYDISGIIGLSGELKGSLSICYNKEVAFKYIKAFADETYEELSEEVRDAVGEIANIISGNAKKGLIGYNVDISLPTIILGASHRITNNKEILSMVVPFTSELGDFEMVLFLKIL